MAQRIPILKFIEKQNNADCSPYQLSILVSKIICNDCAKKKKKGYICVMNNIQYLDLKNNKCQKYKKKKEKLI